MWNEHPNSQQRFIEEPIAWLTTVSGSGVPSTAPVWFYLEDDGTVTVFSRDPSVRTRNLGDNDRVTLHLEGDGRGGAIVVVNGTAAIVDGGPGADAHGAFIGKYQSFLDQYGWTAEWFAENYPTRVSIAATSIRGA